MELNNFLELFQEQYADFDEIQLTLDMDFRMIESYDSLTGMAILVMIKDEFDLDIPYEEYKSIHSVREIYEYTQNKKK